jgi:methylmalonyl-CoA/ethylmalonyl-CoA epimerase
MQNEEYRMEIDEHMNPMELSERLWDLAARVGQLIETLPDTRLGRHVADQLLRCGTLPAPSYDQARSAESKMDLVQKLGVVLKELGESAGWIRFIVKTGLVEERRVTSLLNDATQLQKIIAASRVTAQGRDRKSPMSDQQSSISNPSEDSEKSPISKHGFTGLDHLAIVVPNTEEALAVWRDRLDLAVLYSEVVNDGAVRLTHLDLGNTHLQLVEPLQSNHPLKSWLQKNGPGLHHICFKVGNVGNARSALKRSGLPSSAKPHPGTQGKRALFLDRARTQNVQVELTGN